eukprot:1315947-Amphidinium_carterae.1
MSMSLAKSWKDSWNKPTENYFCGDEILAHMDKLSILRPIEGGIIEDFEVRARMLPQHQKVRAVVGVYHQQNKSKVDMALALPKAKIA